MMRSVFPLALAVIIGGHWPNNWQGQVLGIQIGVSHMGTLSKLLGRGIAVVGTHPESAREWHFAHDLTVLADATSSDGVDAILDTVLFSGWKGKLGTVRGLDGRRLPFGPFGSLDLQMNQTQVAGALQSVFGKPSAANSELTWNLHGPHAWPTQVIASFSNGHLDRVLLTMDVDIFWRRRLGRSAVPPGMKRSDES